MPSFSQYCFSFFSLRGRVCATNHSKSCIREIMPVSDAPSQTKTKNILLSGNFVFARLLLMVRGKHPVCAGGLGEWRNGRRAWLRTTWGNPCRFKSCLAHHPRYPLFPKRRARSKRLAMRRPNKQLPESSGRGTNRPSDDMERQSQELASPPAMIWLCRPPASYRSLRAFTLIELLAVIANHGGYQVPAHRPP